MTPAEEVVALRRKVRQLTTRLREVQRRPGDMPLLGCSSKGCLVTAPDGIAVLSPCRCSKDKLGAAAVWWRRLALFRAETLRSVVSADESLWVLMEALGLTDGTNGAMVHASIAEAEGEVARLKGVARRLEDLSLLRPLDAWGEDDGVCLWWCVPIVEPPYVGTPLDDDFPDYVTHWTLLLEPQEGAS